MLNTDRFDGGYLCDMHADKYKTRETKSCIRGSGKMLVAFAELPETWDHPRVLALVDYFLRREGLFKTADLTTPAHKDLTQTRFPFTWTVTVLEILYAFSKMGYGADPHLVRAWQLLESKRDSNGCYILDYAPGQALLRPGKRGQPNKWITFYALLARKYQPQPEKEIK